MRIPLPDEESPRRSRRGRARKAALQERLEVPLGALVAGGEGFFEESPYNEVFGELLRAPFSWYRVVDVMPNERLVLQDLLLGETLTVHDRLASRSTPKGCIMCTKIAQFEQMALLVGTLPQHLTPTCLQLATETAKKLTSTIETDLRVKLNPDVLAACAPVVLCTFKSTRLPYPHHDTVCTKSTRESDV